MPRLAPSALLLALATGALAQPAPGDAAPPLPSLAHISVGAGNDGPALYLSAGPNLGRLTPHAFGAVTVGSERGETAHRGTAGVGGRLDLGPELGRFGGAATVSAAYSTARAPSPVTLEDGSAGRALTRSGVGAFFGLEFTGWLTRAVGVSVSAHQNVPVMGLTATHSEPVMTYTGEGREPVYGLVSAPRLNHWGVGVGLRVGRQRR